MEGHHLRVSGGKTVGGIAGRGTEIQLRWVGKWMVMRLVGMVVWVLVRVWEGVGMCL